MTLHTSNLIIFIAQNNNVIKMHHICLSPLLASLKCMQWGNIRKKSFFLRLKLPLGRVDSSIIDTQISDPKGNSYHISKPFEK